MILNKQISFKSPYPLRLSAAHSATLQPVHRINCGPLIIKKFNNILMGFKILCQVSNLMSGGRGQKFQNYSRYVTFLFVGLKVRF